MKKIILIILIAFIFLSSCSSTKEKEYLENKYNDTFTLINHQNRGDYELTWFESNTYPDLFVEVETDDGEKFFDDYNVELVKRQFADKVKQDIGGECFIYTGHSTILKNTDFIDVKDISAMPEIISIYQAIFVEENTFSDEEIYEKMKTIREKYPDVRGIFRFIVVKQGTIDLIKKDIRKYQVLNSSDYYDYKIKSSQGVSFSPYLQLPSFVVFDDYSFPSYTELWEK